MVSNYDGENCQAFIADEHYFSILVRNISDKKRGKYKANSN
jgi:hypothetical protein